MARYAASRKSAHGQPGPGSSGAFDVAYMGVPYVPQWRFPESLVVGLATFLSSVAALWWTVRRAVRADVVHAHMGLNVFTAAVVARWRKVPLVTTVNGSDINFGAQVRPGNRFRRWATLRGLRSSRAVIGVSNDLCQKVVDLGIPASKVVQIPNGYDESKFYPMDRSHARRRLGLPLGRKIVLSVGNLVPVKGPDLLVEAFSRYGPDDRKAALYCVGDGAEVQRLREAVRGKGLEESIHFVGGRPHDEVPLWMNACDLFVMASRNEGWPTVLSEVLGCGRPVVATAVGGIPEIIRHDFLGELVEPENAEDLAAAISRNLDRVFDPAQISSFAEQFRWSNIVPRVVDVYRSVLAKT